MSSNEGERLFYVLFWLTLGLSCQKSPMSVPSLASKREHGQPKHDLIGYKNGMFGRQTFEV